MKLTFAGAAGTVTGSRYLFDVNKRRLLIDCELFQGFKVLRLRNRAKIFGQKIPIRAEVHQINGDSAHADADEIINWLKHFEKPPRRVFITHGESEAADSLRKRIGDELHWDAHVPDQLETVTLDFGGAGKT